MASYATVTLTQALALLGTRLYDPTAVRWPDAEKTRYIQEALRTWNALTAFYRQTASFTTTATEPFYDLGVVAPAVRQQTLTIQDAVDLLTYHLLEPLPTGGVWQGTGQFTVAQVIDAVGDARDAFLLETAAVVTRSTPAVTPVPADGRIDLSETVMNVRRAAWKTADGIITILRRDDSWALTHFAPRTWVTQAAVLPTVYSVGETPPLELQLAPVPSAAATLDLMTINRGPALTAYDTTLLGIPDDWAWVVIFGALGELLSTDGIAYDPARATYCQARYAQGVRLARMAPVLFDARIAGVPVEIGSLSDADAYSASWQMVPAVPRRLLAIGQTLVGTWPPPGVPPAGGGYTVSFDLVQNAPVPTVGGDFLQVGPELLDSILDYAQHLALVKEGALAIQQSAALLDKFLEMADVETKLEWALAPNRPATVDQTTQDERVVAYETSNEGTIN